MINKKLLSFDRGALRYVGANVAFQWLGMLCNVIFVRAIARLVGAAFAGSLTSAQLWQNLVLCLATVPMRFAFTMLASAMSDQASKDVKRTLRSSIYAKLARLGPNYTETAATSEVVMLASEGVEQIDTYFAKYLPQLFYSLLAPVTLFVLLVGVHARSAILLLCCVPLIPLSIVAVQKFAKKLLANYWGEYTTLGDSFLENIQGLTTLKIYQADGWKHEEMNAQAERFRKITMKVLTMQLNSVTLMDLMAYGGAGLGIISAASAFAKGQLSLTSALTILLLAADFFLPLRLLGSYFHIAMNGAASAEKIFRLLSAQEPEDGEKTADPADSTLALEHVTFGYEKERTILHNVSLTIPQGSFVSLVGESGCGKSVSMLSVLHLLPDYAKISADKMIFDGTDLTRLTPKMFRKISGDQIGMIFQDPMTSLNPLFTVGDQLIEPLRIHKGISKKEARDLVLEKLRMVEIPDPESRMKQYPHELSGGMRQRIMIAMAIMCNPRLIIADEPTTALDVTIQAQILDLLQSLQKKLGTAVIMITHDLGVIAGMCSRVLVMYGGVVVEEGTVREIFYEPKHPYTWGLLRSIPQKSGEKRKLIPIPGSPPDLIAPPPGCPFVARCPYAMNICNSALPEMTRLSQTHCARCRLLDEGAPRIVWEGNRE